MLTRRGSDERFLGDFFTLTLTFNEDIVLMRLIIMIINVSRRWVRVGLNARVGSVGGVSVGRANGSSAFTPEATRQTRRHADVRVARVCALSLYGGGAAEAFTPEATARQSYRVKVRVPCVSTLTVWRRAAEAFTPEAARSHTK